MATISANDNGRERNKPDWYVGVMRLVVSLVLVFALPYFGALADSQGRRMVNMRESSSSASRGARLQRAVLGRVKRHVTNVPHVASPPPPIRPSQ